MKDREYTTLAFLAQAVASHPDQADEFIAAVRSDLNEASDIDLASVAELYEALDAISAQWKEFRAEGGPATLRDVVEIARNLEDDGNPTHRVPALALVSAVQDILSRKGREATLTDDDREIAEELPALARAAG